MSIWNFLSGIFDPLAKIVDEVHTSDEERMTLKAELLKLQNAATSKLLDYESQLLKSRADIITAEANGGSWLQKSWRPITMLSFLMLVVMDSFGWLANPLAPQAWDLLKIGLGGYVVGRSAEKIVDKIKS